MDHNERRDALLDEIVELELAMFLACPHKEESDSCPPQPEAFRMLRWMAHCIHSEATLTAYYNDLQAALINDRNLMAEKFDRMADKSLVFTSPLVDTIADAENAWLEEAVQLYPHALKGTGQQLFRLYLACELETLSDETLEHYANEVYMALQHKNNLVLERHDLLCKRLGYESLAAKDALLAQEAQDVVAQTISH